MLLTNIFQVRIGPFRLADLAASALLFFLAFGLVYRACDWKAPQYRRLARDVWFDNDSNRVFDAETDRFNDNNDRIALHPAYPYFTFPPVWVLRKAAGLSPETSIRLFHSAIGGLWAAVFFLLLRRFDLALLDALVFTGVAGSSASAMFWMPSIESFTLGSLTLFPPLMLAAGREPGSPFLYYLSGVVSLGVTVTNWMATAFASFVDLTRKRFWIVTAATLGTVLVFGLLHTTAFPGSIPGLDDTTGDAAWIFAAESGGPFAIMRVFFFSGMTAPEIGFVSNWRHPAWPLMTLQSGALFTGSRWALLATPAWAVLLGLGFWSLAKLDDKPRLRVTLVLLLLYQLLLHLLYGRETFLYGMHFTPLLVAVAALAARTKFRPLVLALSVALALANVANNLPRYRWARAYTMRGSALKRVQSEIDKKVPFRKVNVDPTWTYRFWDDVLKKSDK